MNKVYMVVKGVRKRTSGCGNSYIDKEYETLEEARKKFEETKNDYQGYKLDETNFLETLLEIEYKNEDGEVLDLEIIDSCFLTIEEIKEVM